MAWVGLVAAAVEVGRSHRAAVHLPAFPLYGTVERHVTAGTAWTALLGLLLVALLPGAARRLRWGVLLVASAAATAGWGVALASVRGTSRLLADQGTRFEFVAVVPRMHDLGWSRFVRTFADQDVLRTYPIHVQGHPVGTPLVYGVLDRAGLGGATAASAVLIAAWAVVPVLVAVAVRRVAGEDRARAALPFLVLAPAVVWAVTSTDALYAAVGAAMAALAAVAATTPSPRRAIGAALCCGLAAGVGMFLTYGFVLLGLLPLVLLVARGRRSLVPWSAVGALAVVAAFALAGAWWPAGLAATHGRYVAGVSRLRPYGLLTFLGNPAALALVVGPAVAVGLAVVRDRRLWLLAGPALAALVVADLCGLAKGEVERIWLPFAPWLLVLPAALVPVGRRRWPAAVRALLAAQVATALIVESVVLTGW